jgi:amidase
MLTCIAGTSGRPQITPPLAEVDGLPIGLALLGARGADEVRLAFARDLATELTS